VQSFYIPTSNRAFGGIQPKLPVDVFPVRAIWVVPYVLCYLVWIWMALWAIFKMEDHLFRSLVAAGLVTCTLAVSTFIFLPTYVKAEHISGSDFPSRLLNFIHQNSGRYNAFPSGHVYITVLLALFYNLWYPRHKFYWTLIPVIVSLSTLFTHQHYIVDIFGGVVFALVGYYAGLRWARYIPITERDEKRRLVHPPT
jgi:membrane-associated phospholipid phosphatase